jgi:hypothetical protein
LQPGGPGERDGGRWWWRTPPATAAAGLAAAALALLPAVAAAAPADRAAIAYTEFDKVKAIGEAGGTPASLAAGAEPAWSPDGRDRLLHRSVRRAVRGDRRRQPVRPRP